MIKLTLLTIIRELLDLNYFRVLIFLSYHFPRLFLGLKCLSLTPIFSSIAKSNIDNSNPLTKCGNQMHNVNIFSDICQNNFIFPDFSLNLTVFHEFPRFSPDLFIKYISIKQAYRIRPNNRPYPHNRPPDLLLYFHLLSSTSQSFS